MDSNHRTLCERIYSPSPLTTRTPTHKKPKTAKTFGATHRNRTDNLPITNRVLYRIELEWRETLEQKLARVETVTLRANRVKRLIDVIENH
jgi:hypothetical protein